MQVYLVPLLIRQMPDARPGRLALRKVYVSRALSRKGRGAGIYVEVGFADAGEHSVEVVDVVQLRNMWARSASESPRSSERWTTRTMVYASLMYSFPDEPAPLDCVGRGLSSLRRFASGKERCFSCKTSLNWFVMSWNGIFGTRPPTRWWNWDNGQWGRRTEFNGHDGASAVVSMMWTTPMG